MFCCGRSWATCLTAMMTTAAIGPVTAAPYMPVHAVGSRDAGPKPLIVPAPLRGQDRNFSGYGRTDAVETVTEYPDANGSESQTRSLASPLPPVRGHGEGVNPAGWTEPSIETRPSAPQTLGHWVAVVGAVAKPGCYELSARSISVEELMEKCGGLTPAASGTLAVVRDGRAAGLAYNPQDRLLGGDVIVVAEKPSAHSQVTATGLKEIPRSGSSADGVQLGLVNVLDRPVPVLVPASHASVAGVLAIANQTHLRPDQIKVIMGGTDEMFGDQSMELAPGSVLVFPPGSVDAEALGEVETRFYPALAGGEPLPTGSAPAFHSPGPAPSMFADPVTEFSDGQPSRMPSAELGPSVPATDLSSLPRVEMLDAPDDGSLRFPRTADASGTVPIGAPEAGSHIVPFPSDTIDTAKAADNAAPATPEAVTLPEEAESAEDSQSLPTFAEFAPTLLIGTILGAVTFFGLRHWRKRNFFESIASRLPAIPQPVRTVKPLRAPETKSFSPDDMLAALIANRLAIREEAVILSPAMRIHGRSPAMRHRRIDPPHAEIARPHIPISAPHSSKSVGAPFPDAARAAETSRGATNYRLDSCEEATPSKKTEAGNTPFERALAAMRSGQR